METSTESEPTVPEAQAEPADPASTSLHPEGEPSEPATQITVEAPASPPPTAVPAVVASLRKGTPGQRSTSNKENVKPMAAITTSPNTLTQSPMTITPAVPRSHRRSSTYDALEEAVVQGTVSPALSRQPSVTGPSPIHPAAWSMDHVNAPIQEATVQDASAQVQPDQVTQASLVSVESRSVPPEVRVDAPAVVSPSPQPADPILAMDALDEAVEQISAEVPDVQPSPAKPRTKKAAPVVRTTKASLARLSLAQAEKSGVTASRGSTAGRQTPSTSLARASSVRQSIAARPEPPTKRISSISSRKPESTRDGEKKETVIPHSKPRPVSLSFPTPPPPPKSKKAPTTSSFQLPGEAIAAKLKAAREERAQKETDEEQERPAFKARPAPAGLKKAPSVRQTNASKARISSVGDKPTAPTAGLKRASSVRTAPKTASAASPNAPKVASDRLTVAKRQSTAMANTSKPRVSLASTTNAPRASMSGGAQRVPSKGTAKGKEVFSRTAAAKEAAEKEKREKEDLAKKARAEAAERSRQASRDWAEKQRMKKLGLKPAASKATVGAVAPAGVAEDVTAEHAVQDEATILDTTGEIAAGV